MKPIKMFGLAALAALMAMAFLGAGSASAESTLLCTTDPAGGACGSPTTSVHEVSVGKAKLLSSIEVQCNVLFSSTSVGAEGAPQIIKGHFTYTNCGCTVEEEAGTTAKIEVLKEGHETASVTGSGKVKVNCFGIQCTYTGTGLKGTAKGPLLSTEANGEINISEQVLSGSGIFCPTSGKLDIKTSPLAATYIAITGASETSGVEIKFKELKGKGAEVGDLLTLGETYIVTITNTSCCEISITGEGYTSLYLAERGTKCVGQKLKAGFSCTSQQLQCVEKGDAIYLVTTTIGFKSLNVKCD